MRIAVIGGGAAGLFGAIAAAEHNRTAEIVIFEAGNRPLAKVLISGGGRCNVTNNCLIPADLVKNYPRGNKELLGPFNRFQPRDTIAWFNRHGVRLKIEAEGRVFPATDMASTIVDCLLNTAEELKIRIKLGAKVESIKSALSGNNNPEFEVALKKRKTGKIRPDSSGNRKRSDRPPLRRKSGAYHRASGDHRFSHFKLPILALKV